MQIFEIFELKPYQVTAVRQLKEPDRVKHVNLCCWLLDMVADGHMDPMMFIMSAVIGRLKNPNLLFEQPLHDQEIGLWCTMTTKRIVGLIFFDTTVNTDVYLTFLEEFHPQLTEEEHNCCFLQQDGATCHTSEGHLSVFIRCSLK
ncbi:hypothetical protein C0J52_01889 [Blattella germanica]|nr:hypothetical protein C0J52_01889 [Blattella germanica]